MGGFDYTLGHTKDYSTANLSVCRSNLEMGNLQFRLQLRQLFPTFFIRNTCLVKWFVLLTKRCN